MQAVEKTFNGQVVAPYVGMTNDYLMRQRAQNQQVAAFMEEQERTLKRVLQLEGHQEEPKGDGIAASGR